MKKLGSILGFWTLLVLFAGCSPDQQKVLNVADVTGKWQDDRSDRSIEFMSDGTFTISREGVPDTATIPWAETTGRWNIDTNGRMSLSTDASSDAAVFISTKGNNLEVNVGCCVGGPVVISDVSVQMHRVN